MTIGLGHRGRPATNRERCGVASPARRAPEHERFRRVNNDWFNEHLADPCHGDPSLYDREFYPQATAWFREAATEMLRRVDGYLRILDAHGVGWRATWSSDPGTVLYEDEHQIVVVPGPSSHLLAVAQR